MAPCMLLLLGLALVAGALPTKRSESDPSVSEYILEEYRKHKLNQDDGLSQVETQANTIRSLANMAPAFATCSSAVSVFNFSVSDIGDYELPIKSTLILHMKRTRQTDENYFVTIRKLIKADDEETDYITSTEISPNVLDGRLEFELDIFNRRIFQFDDRFVELKVEIRPVSGGGPLDCSNSPLSFVSTDPSEQPYLAVHTHDPKIQNIDYKSMISSLEANDEPEPVRRRKRNSVSTSFRPPACRRNNLHAPISSLLPSLGPGRILLPNEDYNAGVCGGVCGGTLPSVVKHSQFLHFLVTGQNFIPEAGTRFIQCCAPVEYWSLAVVFHRTGEVAPKMITMSNMIIANCDCLEVLEFTK